MDQEMEKMLEEASETANKIGGSIAAVEKVTEMFRKSDTESIVITQKDNLYSANISVKRRDDDDGVSKIDGIVLAKRFISILSESLNCCGNNSTKKGYLDDSDIQEKGMIALGLIGHAIGMAEALIYEED